MMNYLPNKRFLNIIKYSKEMKKVLDVNINDYKKYLDWIEIEIIPKKKSFGRFININNNEKYYHIYFNDNKEEAKQFTIMKEVKIDKIKVIIDNEVKSLYKLFCGCEIIEKISFINFYKDDIINMSHMFSRCSSLKKLNLSNFNTNNVTDMNSMFAVCS